MDEQRKAATKRLRAKFLEIKSEYEYKDIRYPDIERVIQAAISAPAAQAV